MLFMAIYRLRDPSEESHKRVLELFMNWKPPFEIKAHYSRADGNGGVALFEATDAAVVLEGAHPWLPFFDVDICPALDMQESVPIFMRVNDWRDSVKH
jgi:hypothetical protein